MLVSKVIQCSERGLLPQSGSLAYTACYQERCTERALSATPLPVSIIKPRQHKIQMQVKSPIRVDI